jgi:hypothetical protein
LKWATLASITDGPLRKKTIPSIWRTSRTTPWTWRMTLSAWGSLELEDEDDMENLEADAVYSGGYTLDIEGDYWNCSNNNSIFLVSKQISNEALDIL